MSQPTFTAVNLLRRWTPDRRRRPRLWTISADDGPAIPEQARRLRLMADAYGLGDTRGLLDAVIARQEQNVAAALTRTRSPIPAVAEYARASVAWQRAQTTWLRAHQAKLRTVVEA